jgi:hypothetical protein
MKALIDGDIILHRCAGSCEPTKAKPFVEAEDVAYHRMIDLMTRILEESETNEFEVYVGEGKTFRHTLYPAYKANRTKPRPTHYDFLKGVLFEDYKATLVTQIETDDRLGIEQTTHGLESIICSIDKDLLQIPGHHYNFVRQHRSFVSPSDGLRTFYQQLVTGDGTDNIPAFDGKLRNQIPQFIQKLLDPIDDMTDERDMYNYNMALYMGDLETLERNAQLLYIWKENNDKWQPPELSKSIMKRHAIQSGQTLDTMPSSLEFFDKAQDDTHLNTSV